MLTCGYAIAVGAVFYVGQAAASILDGDPGWPRIVTRFTIWVVFCVAMGVATYLRLVWHTEQRHREARARAIRERHGE